MKLRTMVAILAFGSCCGESYAAIRTVALSGQPAPGAPAGTNFTNLYNTTPPLGPDINKAGRVAFAAQATLSATTSTGIWSDASGALTAVARSGTQAPGTSAGINFAALRSPVIRDAGDVAFDATLTGLQSGNAGVWEQHVGTLSLVGRKGNPAPGTAFNFTAFFGPSINSAGQTAFRAQFSSGTTDDVGIWAERSGALTSLVRAGTQAPGTPEGVIFDNFTSAPIAINDAGRIAFKAFLSGPGVSQDVNRMGIWAERNDPPTPTLVARQGSQVPGLAAGANFEFIDDPVMNRNGQTAFVALIVGVPAATNAAIFSEGGGALAIVARRNDAAPGTPAGVKFNSFSKGQLNGEGQVAFLAGLAGGGATTANDSGIWSQRGGALTLVAREGTEAPGIAGVNLGVFANPVLNSAGQLAFTSTLTGGGVTAANDLAIFAQGLGGDLRLVAREGNQLEVSPGVNRTISDLYFAGGVNTEDGRSCGYNDLGEVAFLAKFIDGSSGIFVSDVAKAASGDFDGDADFDGADFLTWQRGVGRAGTGLPNNGDANADGNVDAADLAVWKTKFATSPATVGVAAVPEPSALVLALMALAGLRTRRRS